MAFRKLTSSRQAARLVSTILENRSSATISSLSAAMTPLEPAAPPIVNARSPARSSSEERTNILSHQRAEPDPKVQVFLSAALPAPGFSPVFDSLCGQCRPAKALQMILGRALDDYQVILLSASLTKLAAAYPVEEPLSLVSTSRMMPRRAIEIALAHFDPLGLESARAFGRKLASAALDMFFENERNGIHQHR
ncbi:VirC2 family conjugal transfer protein (plasmid) [Bradyrhizobium quebecense]|uniref:VirC2 family conjugal transfer protein n=1 Tax=Bradyrhizobium quebecense TaxID=2748629 RepID=UPI001CD4CE13|nr:VirC2 family conjugal transfer protein [Bradyrhizobium quebecense]UGA48970.1 VirC2 family conjugal transfer protein [Bradyrhizobium quebecense]